MRHLRRGEFRGIKELITGTQSINYPYKLIGHRYHGFFVTPKLGILPLKIAPKSAIPFHYTDSHLKEDIPEEGITLFGDTHPDPPGSRLFSHRVGAGVFDQFLGVTEALDIFHFGQEFSSKFRRDTLYGRETFQLIFYSGLDFIEEIFFQFFGFGFKELFDIDLEGFLKAFVGDTDGVFGQFDEVFGGEGGFTARESGEDVINFSPSGLSDSLSGGVAAKNFEEGLVEEIEVFFGFGEEGREAVFDLGFGFGDFVFEFLDLAGQEFSFGREGSGFEEVGIGEGKEGQEEGVFFIGLGGVGGGDEASEVMTILGLRRET